MSRIPSTAGITQGLQTPGIEAVSPTLDPNLALAEQTLQSLGSSFGVLAQRARERRAEEERELAKNEVVIRGEFALQAGIDLQEWDAGITEGKIAVPSSHDEVLELANSLVSARVKDAPEVGAKEYRERALVPLIAHLSRRREENAAKAKGDLSLKIEAGLTGKDDVAEWTKAVTYARDTLQMTEAESLSLVVRAMNANAALGHEGAVKAARTVLGDNFGQDQAAADATLRRIAAQQRAESDRAKGDETAADLERVRRGQITEAEAIERATKRYSDAPDMGQAAIEGVKDQIREWRDEQRIDADRNQALAADAAVQHAYRHINDGRPEQAIAYVERERKRGVLSETQANSIIANAQADIQRREAEAVRRAAVAAEERFTQESVNQAVEMFARGELPLIDEREATLPGGGTVKLTQKELRDSAIQSSMARIAAENPNDPQAMLEQQVQALARNGAIHQQYADVMQAGARSTLIDLLGNEKAHGEVTINQNALAGFELYRNMRALSPAVADDHLDDTSKAFYRYALTAFEFGPNRGDPARALAQAAKIMGDRESAEFRARQVDDADILRRVSKYDFSNWPLKIGTVRNREDMARIVYERAKALALVGVGSEAATKAAIDTVRTDVQIVNGFGVFVNRTTLPRHYIEAAGEAAVNDYWTKHGAAMQAQGFDKDDLTLAPSDENTWTIVLGRTGEPVFNWSEGGVYANRGLIEMVKADRKLLIKASAAQQRLNQQNRANPRRSRGPFGSGV